MTNNIRKLVCVIANRIKKSGMTLSQAFKQAWAMAKKIMDRGIVTPVNGTMAGNRQRILEYFCKMGEKNCTLSLMREDKNEYDPNAVAVKMHCACTDGKNRVASIGYLPKDMAFYMAAVIDAGIEVTIALKGIYGGIGGKNFGVRGVVSC